MSDLYGFLFIITAILLIANGLIGWFEPDWHGSYCQEQLKHAATAGDTLVIYRNDKYCLKEVVKK